MFLSRSAGKSEKDKTFIEELECQGCSAQAIAGSVADIEVVKHVVNIATKPIKGMFQLSMALPNTAFIDMSYSDWQDGLLAKVDGTWVSKEGETLRQQLNIPNLLGKSLSSIC